MSLRKISQAPSFPRGMPDDPKRPATGSDQDQSPWALAGLGAQFFAAILIFVYAGNWLDRRFGTGPLLLLASLLVGGGGSFVLSYRGLMRRQREAEQRQAADRTAKKSDGGQAG